ncbi:lipoprotein [Streptomyces sp. NBRC 14336]|uniref:DUF461 domain-containing protein n=1 Tax=Streptomyces sp. NBRC 14336 TaxID=3030992 RepID=UPI0024A16BBC|nr:DUF461 domain-containing protein [Streptomyces sp. NBRC 14336]WBO78800.1 copper chaperone PCu(A)C [Streptomyces sp. SBE_14.2]GLW49758.1 lipoprotein [Streptomyces sp. NBRC 14336]
MSSSLRRGVRAAAAITFSLLPLAACAAGNDAQTLQIKPDNAATTVGDIKIQNALVITQPDQDAAGPAVVSATLFNNSTKAQKLESVTVEGASGPAELKAAKGKSLTIPAGGSLILGGADNAAAVLTTAPQEVADGNAQKVTFTFSETGEVSLRAFVVPAEGYFTGWGPSEVPTAPEKTASPTDEPTGEASGEATGEPGDEETTEGAEGSTGTPTDAASASNSAAGN